MRNIAVHYVQQGLHQLAKHAFDGAIDSFTLAVQNDSSMARAYYCRSFVRARTGNELALALSDIDEAIRLSPQCAEALLLRAHLRRQCSDLDGALADANNAQELSTSAEGHLILAATRLELGHIDEAAMECELALKREPRSAHAIALRGAAWHRQKKYDLAIDAFSKAIALNPNMAWVLVLRGQAYYHSNQNGLLADFRKAFAADPSEAARQIVHSLVATIGADAANALKECDDHLKSSPIDPITFARRGLTFLLVGRADEARADIDRFVQFLGQHEINYLHLVIEEVERYRQPVMRYRT